MNAKVGDSVTFYSTREPVAETPVVYRVLELGDTWVRVKHPTISGYFVFSKKMIMEVLSV